MEIKEWRSLAIQSVSLFLAVLICSICFAGRVQQKPVDTVMAEGKRQEEVQEQEPVEEEETEQEDIQTAENATRYQVENRSDTYIRVPKTEEIEAAEVYIRNDYMASKLQITFRGVATGSVTKDSILRIHGYEVKKGPAAKKESILKKIVINDQKNPDTTKNIIQVEMLTKKLYEPVLFEAEDAYYISLLEPNKAYEHIVVIDAGHGGMDEGTSSRDGRYVEKDYTLLVVKRLRKLLQEENVKVYYTRLEDKKVSNNQRARLVNSLGADMLISIHCNASSVGDTTAYGMETLYAKQKLETETLTGKQLAQIMLNNMEKSTGLRRRGVIQRDELYLLRHAKAPATIVEIGYMSNSEDLKFIRKESGQQKIAVGIRDGILQALAEK